MELLLLQANGAALGLPDYWGPADEARRAKSNAAAGQKDRPKDAEEEEHEEDWEDDEEESEEEGAEAAGLEAEEAGAEEMEMGAGEDLRS